MGGVPAAVAEGARRATEATAAFAATDHPPPLSIISLLAGCTRIRSDDSFAVTDLLSWHV